MTKRKRSWENSPFNSIFPEKLASTQLRDRQILTQTQTKKKISNPKLFIRTGKDSLAFFSLGLVVSAQEGWVTALASSYRTLLLLLAGLTGT